MVVEESRRVFSVDGIGDFYISTPTADDVRGGDWCYSKSYNRSLFDGVATLSEVQDILRKRGIIGDEYDKKLQALRESIGNKVAEMELSSDREEKRKLAFEVSKLREDLFQWSQRSNGPLSHCCEQIAEDQRLEYLVSCIVQDKAGKRVWPTFEAYLQEPNRVLSFRSRFETMLFLNGMEASFLETTPENMVLKNLDEVEAKEATARDAAPPVMEVVAAPVIEGAVDKPSRKKRPPKSVE